MMRHLLLFLSASCLVLILDGCASQESVSKSDIEQIVGGLRSMLEAKLDALQNEVAKLSGISIPKDSKPEPVPTLPDDKRGAPKPAPGPAPDLSKPKPAPSATRTSPPLTPKPEPKTTPGIIPPPPSGPPPSLATGGSLGTPSAVAGAGAGRRAMPKPPIVAVSVRSSDKDIKATLLAILAHDFSKPLNQALTQLLAGYDAVVSTTPVDFVTRKQGLIDAINAVASLGAGASSQQRGLAVLDLTKAVKNFLGVTSLGPSKRLSKLADTASDGEIKGRISYLAARGFEKTLTGLLVDVEKDYDNIQADADAGEFADGKKKLLKDLNDLFDMDPKNLDMTKSFAISFIIDSLRDFLNLG